MLELKKLITVAGLIGLIISTSPSWGGDIEDKKLESKIYAIENMTCATCPITVRQAMRRVDGVHSVEVDFTAKTATATYDPTVTSAAVVAEASDSVGFPAKIIDRSAP